MIVSVRPSVEVVIAIVVVAVELIWNRLDAGVVFLDWDEFRRFTFLERQKFRFLGGMVADVFDKLLLVLEKRTTAAAADDDNDDDAMLMLMRWWWWIIIMNVNIKTCGRRKIANGIVFYFDWEPKITNIIVHLKDTF